MRSGVVVTGLTGLIGRHLCGCVPYEGDLTEAIRLPKGTNVVVHLAQSRRYKDGPDGYADVWAVNADATFRLLDAARKAGVERFIYASTGSVENPRRLYDYSKLAGEGACNAFSDVMEIMVLRFYAVYGPGQRADCLVSSLVERIKKGEPVTNGIKTAPLYAKDAAEAVLCAVNDIRTGCATVSGPEVLTAHEMAITIGRHFNIEPVLEDGYAMPVYRHSDFVTTTKFAEGLALSYA